MSEDGREKIALREEPSLVMDQHYRRAKLRQALAAMAVERNFPEKDRSVVDALIDAWSDHSDPVQIDDDIINKLSLDAIRIISLLLDECAALRWRLAVTYHHQTTSHIEDDIGKSAEFFRAQQVDV